MASIPAPLRRIGAYLHRHRRVLLALVAVVVLLIGAAGYWLVAPFWEASGQFEDVPVLQPTRLYAQPEMVRQGELFDADRVIGALEAEGYSEVAEGERLRPGGYRRGEGEVTIFLRRFPTASGEAGGLPLRIELDGRRVRAIDLGEEQVEVALLEPPLVAAYYGDDLKERRPVRVDDLPENLVEAVLAAEDDEFFLHQGLSATGILRAAWVNLRAGGEVRQGGSTLTQQLVKNLYLTHERTVSRKLREAVLASIVELRYSKRRILQAYLNEIYLGSADGVNLIGVGAASRAFFGKDPSQLDLAEAATLAGMIRSPANYSPIEHPEAARERRNQILDRLIELEWVDRPLAEAAKATPVRTAPEPVVRRRAPYFAAAMAAEAERRFGIPRDELADGGYTLLSTLDWDDQQVAQEAVAAGLESLEKGWEKGNDRATGPLQAALVSVEPASGGIRAYVGGRDFGESQFDRAGNARRQAGSAFKPVVYAAAFESRQAGPATLLDDAPLTVKISNQTWQPKNDDGAYRGWITARTALERSINIPTVRLALQVGLQRVIDTARAMGVEAPLEPMPSLALGAFEVTPVEVATVYATLANGGVRPPVHGLQAVFDREGRPVDGEATDGPRRVLSPQTSYLLTSVLQGVTVRGTAAGARRMGLQGPIAGKTGTTNERRDSWFAGYSPDRTTVTWVGYDDNAPTRMSGARAALPIWTRFTVGVAPPGGYREFDMPPGLATATVDPASGELATDACPSTVTEVFRTGEVPRSLCHLHRAGYDFYGEYGEYGYEGAYGAEDYELDGTGDDEGWVRRWTRRIFGDDEAERAEPESADERWRERRGPRPPAQVRPPDAPPAGDEAAPVDPGHIEIRRSRPPQGEPPPPAEAEEAGPESRRPPPRPPRQLPPVPAPEETEEADEADDDAPPPDVRRRAREELEREREERRREPPPPPPPAEPEPPPATGR